jgi:hypothetical protein
MIEHGKATPSDDLLGRLVNALNFNMDDLHV